MAEPITWPTAVLVTPAIDPTGRPSVLLQLEHGFVLLQPLDAIQVAENITLVAEAVLGSASPDWRPQDG